MRYTHALLLLSLLAVVTSCSKKQAASPDTTAPTNSVNDSDTAIGQLEEKTLRVDTFMVNQYHGAIKPSNLIDSEIYLYVSYSNFDTLHITCSQLITGKHYSDITINYRAKVNDSGKYMLKDPQPSYERERQLIFKGNSIKLSWLYHEPMKPGPGSTGGWMPAHGYLYGWKVSL